MMIDKDQNFKFTALQVVAVSYKVSIMTSNSLL